MHEELPDPGAAQYGNFIDYYKFNPKENRIKILKDKVEWFFTKSEGKDDLVFKSNTAYILDIGCNTGELTVGFFELLTDYRKDLKLKVLAIDLDEALIETAKRTNPYPEEITFMALDFMDEQRRTSALDAYFTTHGIDRFDLVLAFSVTMWIHLNHGDQGFRNFFIHMGRLSSSLLVEPQQWKSYGSAKRRRKRAGLPDFPFTDLKYRYIEQEIHGILHQELQMYPRYQPFFGITEWKRRIYLFTKM